MQSLQTRELLGGQADPGLASRGPGQGGAREASGGRARRPAGPARHLGKPRLMVFHREVPLELVDEFYSGPIVHS
jgi:hypothetical protein